MEERSVRRRLNENHHFASIFESGEVKPHCLQISDLSTLCGRLAEEFKKLCSPKCQTDSSVTHSELCISDKYREILAVLRVWVEEGLPRFQGLSNNRSDRWESYCNTEKWVYHSVHLMNSVLKWNCGGNTTSMFLYPVDTSIPSDSYTQVSFLLSLAKLWNECSQCSAFMQVEFAIFASLESVWFGYPRAADQNEQSAGSIVHMAIDEAEEDQRLIVNRLEATEDYDDFAYIMYQNTITNHSDAPNAAVSLVEADLLYLIWARLFDALLATYVERKLQIDDPSSTDPATANLSTARGYLWNSYHQLNNFQPSLLLSNHTLFLLGKLLVVEPSPPTEPAGGTLPAGNEFAAFGAALRENPAHYVARQCLVESYLAIGENFLAHQHCLFLLTQLSAYSTDEMCTEAPLASGAYAFAAELVDTVLHDIHLLHLRGEEGYELLEWIPTMGDTVHVEWALDDEIVCYTGKIDLHSDRNSLCISYDDDTVHGQHRRRFENATHLVNINDPADPYLEVYHYDYDHSGSHVADEIPPVQPSATETE